MPFLAGLLAAAALALPAAGFDVSGTVSYDGIRTGTVLRVLAATNAAAWSSPFATNVAAGGGAYALRGLPGGTGYWIRAYADTDGSGTRALTEPSGAFGANPVPVTQNLEAIGFRVYDGLLDLNGWWRNGGALYEPGFPNRAHLAVSGTGFDFDLEDAAGRDSRGLRVTVGTGGYAYVSAWVGAGTDGVLAAYGCLPQPGRRYRLSFDARSDTVNQLLRLHWYSLAYVSSNAARNKEHFYLPDAALLGTNWQTFAKDVFFDHDDAFVKFAESASSPPRFKILLTPDRPGTYYFDNFTITERPLAPHVPDALANAGFERGFYGWTDETRWAFTGIGDPSSETGTAHWAVCTNNPHSGRSCLTIALPPFRNVLDTFEPRLVGGGMELQRGANYVFSYWRREDPPTPHLLMCMDYFSTAHAAIGWDDRGTNWHRVVLPLYRYGEPFANTNYTWVATGPPKGDRPAVFRVDVRHDPWTRRIWVDDFQLDAVTESEALDLLTNRAAAPPPPSLLAEQNDPYDLSTSLAGRVPFQRLYETSSLALPVLVERHAPAAPSSGTLHLTLRDFLDAPVHTQSVVFTLTGGTYSNAVPVPGFSSKGVLPHGLYTYEWSMTGVVQTASDRFWVAPASNGLAGLGPEEGFVGFDRWDLAYALAPTSPMPRRVLGEYDFEHLKLFSDIGGRWVRLWINGRGYHEVDFLETLANQFTTHGFEVLVCIAGLSMPDAAYGIGDAASWRANWSAGSWAPFVSALAARLKGKVRHYSVGNELWALSPSEYVSLLTNTWSALKGVDTGIVVHAFDQILERGTLDLIGNTYLAGAASCVDVADYHAYYPVEEEDDILSRLQSIVHRYEDGKPSYAQEYEKYLSPTNCPVWQTEYQAAWAKITPGNRVTDEERAAALTLACKMVTAKAYGVRRFILYDTRPSFVNNGLFANPMHAPALSPAVSLLYAGVATLAEQLTRRELNRVYIANGVRAYGFGQPGTTNVSVVAAWATAQELPVVLASGVPPFRLTRLDGSSFLTNGLSLTGSPVFLGSQDGAAYDWTRAFGTNSLAVP